LEKHPKSFIEGCTLVPGQARVIGKEIHIEIVFAALAEHSDCTRLFGWRDAGLLPGGVHQVNLG